MEKVLNVAKFIVDEYKAMSKTKIDEMKLHKLLYFSQRENLALLNEPLFEETFQGWKFGPVCVEVRGAFWDGDIHIKTESLSDEAAYIVKNVILTYGELASWKLSELSHKETSWRNSRNGLGPSDNGDVPLRIEDIRLDAKKVRAYDHVWDMYYDEFDDVEVN